MPSVAAHITHITLTAPTAPMLLRYSRPLREVLLALLALLKALTLTNSTYATALLKGVTLLLYLRALRMPYSVGADAVAEVLFTGGAHTHTHTCTYTYVYIDLCKDHATASAP